MMHVRSRGKNPPKMKLITGCALLWYGAVVLAVAATASPTGSTAPLVGWGGSGNSMMMRHARVVRHKRSMGTLQLRGGGSDAEYDSKDAIKYDRAIWEILKDHPDEIHFLNTIFNFLQRRTPCFSGPDASTHYRILIDTLTHQKEVYEQHIKGGTKPPAHVPMPDKPERSTPVPRAKPAAAASVSSTQKGAATAEQAKEIAENFGGGGPDDEYAEADKPGSGVMDVRSEDEKRVVAEQKKKAALGQKPVNNGGKTDKYVWTQTLSDVSAEIPLPQGTRARELVVDVQERFIKVATKTGQVILEGKLEEKCQTSETVWAVEDGTLQLTIGKDTVGEKGWWKCFIKGDPFIDLKQIDPENTSLGELDPELRQTVEKMMYDQKLKSEGKPTLEQQKNSDVMAKFMDAHPEMDFSKCKIG